MSQPKSSTADNLPGQRIYPPPGEPLDKIVNRAWDEFAVESRTDVWMKSKVRRVEVAETCNVASVPLVKAATATLHGLDHADQGQDDLEYTDWMLVGWTPAGRRLVPGVPPARSRPVTS
jgi:hypothetical protein